MGYINDFVPIIAGKRKAMAGGRKQLEKLIEDCWTDGWVDIYKVYDKYPQVRADLESKKVDVSCENWEICTKVQTTEHGLDYLEVEIAGDWEHWVRCYIYWDGKKMRGYIPLHGNMVNTLSKAAFGNADDSCEPQVDGDIAYLLQYGYIDEEEFGYTPLEDMEFNSEACLRDFTCHVTVNGVTIQPNPEDVNTGRQRKKYSLKKLGKLEYYENQDW